MTKIIKRCPYCGEKITDENIRICPVCAEKIPQNEGVTLVNTKIINIMKLSNPIKIAIVVGCILLLSLTFGAGKNMYMNFMIQSLYGTTKLGLQDLEKLQMIYTPNEREKILFHAYGISSNGIRNHCNKDMPHAINGTISLELAIDSSKDNKQLKKNHYYKQSKEEINKALQINPNNYIALNTLGKYYMMDKDYKNAIVHFDKAIEQNPKFAEAYFNRGDCRAFIRSNTFAMSDYNSAIKYAPKVPKYYETKALFELYVVKDKDAALNDINKCIELYGKTPVVSGYYISALIKKEMSDYKGALKDCEIAISLMEQANQPKIVLPKQELIDLEKEIKSKIK